MRWRWARGDERRETVDAIDVLDVGTLEVIELDADGRRVDIPRRPAHDGVRELADHPPRRDPTGTAGLWEALEHS